MHISMCDVGINMLCEIQSYSYVSQHGLRIQNSQWHKMNSKSLSEHSSKAVEFGF